MKIKGLSAFWILILAFSAIEAQAARPFERPYMHNWRNINPDSKLYDNWKPTDWISDEKSAQDVIDGFYRSGIVTDQYFKDGTPALEVGQSFLQLSSRDQRRVLAFVDYAFKVRQMAGANAMQIYLKRGKVPLGIYAQGHLQLQ